MRKQTNFSRLYSADLVFPPWDGLAPWAPPLTMASTASEGEQR
jgi:hypothetical protein